jgi:hypothetical protein
MPANEASFRALANVPVHYDRLAPPFGYGSKGRSRQFFCRAKLKTALEKCFKDLFDVWGRDKPSIILTAGTLGDGANAHGQGFAFDLDGFYWGDQKFMMIGYPSDRQFYLGINAHLFLYFSQVLSFHYPNHADHFHVDFNFSFKFRPESNAQTFFVQACLKYVYDREMGNTGVERDGVDGIFGGDTKAVLKKVLTDEGLPANLGTQAGWRKFLLRTRERAFVL